MIKNRESASLSRKRRKQVWILSPRAHRGTMRGSLLAHGKPRGQSEGTFRRERSREEREHETARSYPHIGDGGLLLSMCFEAIDQHVLDALERAAENVQIRQRRLITTRAQAVDSHGSRPFGRFQHIHIQVRERHIHVCHRRILSLATQIVLTRVKRSIGITCPLRWSFRLQQRRQHCPRSNNTERSNRS